MVRSPCPADVLAVFVKAPEPGRVKTRLAAAIGTGRATLLYRRMGYLVTEQCAAPESHHTVVWYTPARGEAAVRAWLGCLPVDDLLPQAEGGLGERLDGTFDRHFGDGARRVIVIGSDCPTIARALIHRAFQSLAEADLVVSPSRDGGFCLLGLRAPAPGLFRRVEWSSDAVYRRMMLNAAQLGLTAAVLPELRDVDTVADAHALGLLEPGSFPWNGARHEHPRGA
jgi:uncharacterized protein